MKTLQQRIDTISHKYRLVDAIDIAYQNAQGALYHMRCRLDKRITAILERDNAVFYTLTVSDPSLEVYGDDYLERRVKDWCQKELSHWVGNRDYGIDERFTQRIHWHVIGNMKTDKSTRKRSWRYGDLQFDRCYNKNVKKIRNYVLKLVAHAKKAGASKIFRSKNI